MILIDHTSNYFTLSIDSNISDEDQGTILHLNTTVRNEEIDDVDDVEEGCAPTDAGERRGISSIWCNQNCAGGRHPACRLSSGVHQFCKCLDESMFISFH